MSEDLKALSRRLIDEVINGGELDKFEELVSPDWIDHSPFPGQAQGIEGAKQRLAMLRSAFPDFNITVEEEWAVGDTVVHRVKGSGTQRGEWMGFPASGKSFEVEAIEILRYRDGKEISHRGLIDQMSMMMQLGLLQYSPFAAADGAHR
ncbi:MAG: ester cyclase [Actinomycetota bacterium]|nr:ester cyclase [Actinomycetota bacterium]